MLGSQLTTRAVYLFGAVLILLGLAFISAGVPIVRMEIGWTEMIGGAVAASAGCIILVLGLFLARLEALQEALDRLSLAAVETTGDVEPFAAPAPAPAAEAEPARVQPLHPLAPMLKRERAEPAAPTEVRPEPALAVTPPPLDEVPAPAETPLLAESAPALLHADEEQIQRSPVVEPVVAREARQRSSFLSSILAKRPLPGISWRDADPEVAPAAAEPVPAPLAEPPAATPLRRTVVDLSSGWDEEAHEPERPPVPEPTEELAPHATLETDEASAPLAGHEDHPHEEEARSADIHTLAPKGEPSAAQPVVVGRYNAGAASYVMYSNGMIEVETEQGTHQFASMQELKAFIERRDTAARAY